jgi:sulfotransferase
MISEQKKNKKLFFLMGMPRSGNTLFASIMNQNPEIVCTANSITLEIMKDLYLLKETDVFQNFPDHKSLNNILDLVYDLYYKEWPQRIIIDRGPVLTTGNPGNFELMKVHFKRPFKCIVLLRNLMDVLASYMKWYTENSDAFVNKHGLKNDEEKLMYLLKKDSAVIKDLKAIENAFKHQDICHFVKYDNLIANPEEEIKKIYKFIDEPYFNHRFIDLDQININGLSYNDNVVGRNMHTVRKGKIEKIYNPYVEKIPQSIRDKYEHIRF